MVTSVAGEWKKCKVKISDIPITRGNLTVWKKLIIHCSQIVTRLTADARRSTVILRAWGVKESLMFSNHGVCNMLNELRAWNDLSFSVKATPLLHLSSFPLSLLCWIRGYEGPNRPALPVQIRLMLFCHTGPPADVTQSLVKGVRDEAVTPHRLWSTRSEHATSHLRGGSSGLPWITLPLTLCTLVGY